MKLPYMGKIVEFRKGNQSPQPLYLTGKTLLLIWDDENPLVDAEGAPVQETEYYEIHPSTGVRKVV